MAVEIKINFQIHVQCAEKAISRITFNIQWKFGICGTPEYQWVTNIKGLEKNGVWVAW